jgi:hypothetical protein
MRRREFIAGVYGVITLPVVARAQQPAKLPTIGFLGAGTASSQGQWVAALVQRLRELGWIEGQTVALAIRLLSPTGFASTPWRPSRNCRAFAIKGYTCSGLMSYGPDNLDLFRRAGELALGGFRWPPRFPAIA